MRSGEQLDVAEKVGVHHGRGHRNERPDCRTVSRCLRPSSRADAGGVGDRGGGRCAAAGSGVTSSTRRWPAGGCSTGRWPPPGRWPPASSWWCRPTAPTRTEPGADVDGAGGRHPIGVGAGRPGGGARRTSRWCWSTMRPVRWRRRRCSRRSPAPCGPAPTPSSRRCRSSTRCGTATAAAVDREQLCSRCRRRRAFGAGALRAAHAGRPRPPTMRRWSRRRVAGSWSWTASAANLKITERADLVVAAALLER